MKYSLLIVACLLVSAINVGVFAFAEELDSDGDGIMDEQEINLYHTDKDKSDTDGDGKNDGEEVSAGYSPLTAKKIKLSESDSDKDGLVDSVEIALKTNILEKDSDGDNYPDGVEVSKGFNPRKGDRDRSLSRHVEVDLSTQQMNYFMDNVKIGSVPVSTGKLSTPTPVGEFAVIRKLPVHRYVGPGYDLPNTKWNLEFKRSFYLHGAYWHNQFGIRPMSHGCVNISTENAGKIYAFLDVGDVVKITGKTPTKPIVNKKTVAKK